MHREETNGKGVGGYSIKTVKRNAFRMLRRKIKEASPALGLAHRGPPIYGFHQPASKIPSTSSHSSWTPLADVSKADFSSAVNSYSKISSTPFFPRRTGTPI